MRQCPHILYFSGYLLFFFGLLVMPIASGIADTVISAQLPPFPCATSLGTLGKNSEQPNSYSSGLPNKLALFLNHTFLRMENRNVGYTGSAILTLSKTQKLNALVEMLRANSTTDIFMLQEISPSVRQHLMASLGDSYYIFMAPEKLDVAILVDRRRSTTAIRPIPDSQKAWVSAKGFISSRSSLDERYGWLAQDFYFTNQTFLRKRGGDNIEHASSSTDPNAPYASRAEGFNPITQRLRIISLHAPAPGKWRGAYHRTQAYKAVRTFIEDGLQSGMIVILSGDFNLQPDNQSNRIDQEALKHLFEMADARSYPTPTFRFLGIQRRYDHTLAYVPKTPSSPLSLQLNKSHTSRQEIPRTDHLKLGTEFIIMRRSE